jgi:cation diffusion facilitator CzcD-associated flavoprotein CzcO
MQMWRRQLRTQIADPRLREKCVPDYVMGCKRVLFFNDWYPALARPNVELVTEPIERIASGGVVTADGALRPADVIVYGTGGPACGTLRAAGRPARRRRQRAGPGRLVRGIGDVTGPAIERRHCNGLLVPLHLLRDAFRNVPQDGRRP